MTQETMKLPKFWQDAVNTWVSNGYLVDPSFDQIGKLDNLIITDKDTEIKIYSHGVALFLKPLKITRFPKTSEQAIEIINDWLKIANDSILLENAKKLINIEIMIRKSDLTSKLCAKTDLINSLDETLKQLLSQNHTNTECTNQNLKERSERVNTMEINRID